MSNDAFLIGRTLANKYAVEEVLGTGAMGVIFGARQIALDKPVAIKVLHRELAGDPNFVERFKREAFSASRLDHPNSLRVLDFGEDDDLLYLVTEYVHARDLLAVMEAEWPLEDARIVDILSQVLAALGVAHDLGIVHRDLKPENILVLAGKDDDGSPVDVVKVCDFGVAKLMAAPSRPFASRLTSEGLVVGTPDYMSPEQARGQHVDGRSDLYSIGVVLYHLLAGRTPFMADTPFGIALQHVSEPPVPPSHHRKVHTALEEICLRALNKRPEERFQTALEMRRALRAALTARPKTSSVVPARKRPAALVPSSFSTSTAPAALRPRSTKAQAMGREDGGRRWRVSLGAIAVVSVATISTAAVIARRRPPAPPAELAEAGAPAAVITASFVPGPSPAPAPPPLEEVSFPPDPGPSPEPPQAEPVAPVELAKPLAQATQRPNAPPNSEQRNRRAAAPPPRQVRAASEGPPAPEPWDLPPEPETKLPTIAELPVAKAPPRDEPPAPPPQIPIAAPQPVQPPVEARAPVLDVSRASVAFLGVTTSAGISGGKVRMALSHVPLAACYKRALAQRPTPVPLDTVLRLSIDVTGHVVSASLTRDGDLPGLRACIETEARRAQIRDVDTGDGVATVQLTFSPR